MEKLCFCLKNNFGHDSALDCISNFACNCNLLLSKSDV